MSIPDNSKTNIMFNKMVGKSSTSLANQYFEESINGRPAVYPSQIWSQFSDIPNTAPGGTDQQVTGVVKRWIDLTLTAVPGTTNAFSSANLKNSIPFSFGDGSYNYAIKDSTNAAIPFGQGDWFVDNDTGTLWFTGTLPSNMPPKISFYQYVGETADVGGLGGGGGNGIGANNYFEGENYDFEDGIGDWVAESYASKISSSSAGSDTVGIDINVNNLIIGKAYRYFRRAGFSTVGGLTEGATYYVRTISTGNVGLALTPGGAAINITNDALGVLVPVEHFEFSVPNESLAISLETTTPIAGLQSLKVEYQPFSAAGDAFSCPLNKVDLINLNKVMQLTMSVDARDADYTGGEFVFYIIDTTTHIPVSRLVNSGSEKLLGDWVSTFQMNPSSPNLKLLVQYEYISLGTNFVTIYVDNVIATTSTLGVSFPLISGWEPKTIILNSNTGVSAQQFWCKRVAQDLWFRGYVQYSGAGAATTFTMQMPDALTIDAAITVGSSVSDNFAGGFWYDDSGGLSNGYSVVRAGTNTISFRRGNELASNSFAANDRFTVFAIIPISQWRNNTLEGYASQSNLENLTATSSTKTPTATDNYALMTGNSMVLKAGKTYDLFGSVFFGQSGAVTYTYGYVGWFAANGADSASAPALLSTLTSLQVLSSPNHSSVNDTIARTVVSTSSFTAQSYNPRVRVFADTTVYLVPIAGMNTPANARFVANLNAREVSATNTSIYAVPDAELILSTCTGSGSTVASVLRYNSTPLKNTASSFVSFVQSATAGDSIVALVPGDYEVGMQYHSAGASREFGITKNGPAVTTNIASVPAAQVVVRSCGVASRSMSVSKIVKLNVGDIIRANDDQGTPVLTTDFNRLWIKFKGYST